MHAVEIDRIARVIDEGLPHIGAETEGISTSGADLSVVHEIDGEQPTQAVKNWLRERLSAGQAEGVVPYITPDVPETTIEANPEPMRSPLSSAASQRLLAIMIDIALEQMSGGDFHTVHGASLRPAYTTENDASRHVAPWKQIYYRHQLGVHGSKMAEAAGDHLNLSAPWTDQNPAETTRKMIEMTSRMRLIGGALSMALSASSPLHYYANGGQHEPTFGTALTQFESARLGQVWPRRTVMDVPGLYESPAQFRQLMQLFAEEGTLKSGRDVWLPVRAQAGNLPRLSTFEETCASMGIDPLSQEATQLLNASFEYGPHNRKNPHADNLKWQRIEAWRQGMLSALIGAPRNRVEIRTMETPPAFHDQTPYEYIKAVQNFFDLLFIYLSSNPDFVANLEYHALNLQKAKHSEETVLRGGMDAKVYWIPDRTTTTPREILAFLLDKIRDLASGMGRTEDLAIIEQIVKGGLKTPAARIRQEVGDWYEINVENRHNARLLKDDSYPRDVLSRTRHARGRELEQIRADLKRMPALDQPYISQLLDAVDTLTQPKDERIAAAAG